MIRSMNLRGKWAQAYIERFDPDFYILKVEVILKMNLLN